MSAVLGSPMPFYLRMWFIMVVVTVLFAGVVGATAVLLWPQDQQFGAAVETTPKVESAPARAAWSQATGPPARRPTPTTTTLRRGVLWQRSGSGSADGDRFVAPGRWRLEWSFYCQGFARYGGGNFKISGDGAFQAVSVQAFAVRGRGSRWVTGGGPGRLRIESVCDRWMLTAVRP